MIDSFVQVTITILHNLGYKTVGFICTLEMEYSQYTCK